MPRVEGGGPNPPYKESFLENIINVSWVSEGKGGVWVSGDFCCFERFTWLPTDTPYNFAWLPLGPLAFTPHGDTYSGSYAKTPGGPVFLLGGDGPFSGDGGYAGMIMRSRTGYSDWAVTMHAGEAVIGIVWDKEEKQFFATGDRDSCISSHDGVRWLYSNDFFGDHCKNPLGYPDGLYGYSKRHDIAIYPNSDGDAVAVVGASTGDAEEFTIWVGMPTVQAISYQGGVWHAGGGTTGVNHSITTTSWDAHHWFTSSVGDLGMEGDFAITTMVGAPLKDFPGHNMPASRVMGGYPLVPISRPPTVQMMMDSYARRPPRPELGVMAAAISPPRRFRPRVRGAKWSV